MTTIEKLRHSIDFDNLIFHYKGPTSNPGFNNFINATTPFDEI